MNNSEQSSIGSNHDQNQSVIPNFNGEQQEIASLEGIVSTNNQPQIIQQTNENLSRNDQNGTGSQNPVL